MMDTLVQVEREEHNKLVTCQGGNVKTFTVVLQKVR
jgi:hypothetical protein